MKVHVLAWLAVAFLAGSVPVRAAEVAGAAFDETARVGETNLALNGAGLRSKFLFKVYAIGLYLPRKTGDAGQAVGQSGPKRVRIVTLRDVGAEMFTEGLTKGVEKNHGAAELAVLKPRMDQFGAVLRTLGEVAKGSVVTLDLLPGNLTRLSVNGAPLGKDIAGEDFYQALLRVWLGEHPAQDDLKTELLGH
ncbi:MAG: hypothetical protein HGA75_12185 [Thiobacillus sp.]|nr:hypothetical protein [Thiobacillus sp.]